MALSELFLFDTGGNASKIRRRQTNPRIFCDPQLEGGHMLGGHKLFLVIFTAILLLAGCADNQDEVDRLEKEMKAMEADSIAAEDSLAVDTVAESPNMGDAEAVLDEEPVRTMPQRPESSGFTVQVAGCENREYAIYLVDVYEQRGYQPYVTSYVKDGQTYYRVRIGITQTKAEAEALRDELKDKYSIEPWIDMN